MGGGEVSSPPGPGGGASSTPLPNSYHESTKLVEYSSQIAGRPG